MLARILPRPLSGTIAAIPSKSHVHRLLLAAAVADGPTLIRCAAVSDDLAATARCIAALGARAQRTAAGYLVTPGTQPAQDALVDCGESGTTFRLLLPMVAALGNGAQFQLAGRLPQRPLAPLDAVLQSHGCTLSDPGCNPFACAGKLQSGTYTLAGNVSSQFISGLLFALPLVCGDSRLRLTGPVSSASYIQMTLRVLKQFGVTVRTCADGYDIPGGQQFHSPRTITAEGDWSNAAFWLCAGALSGPVTVTGLEADSVQGDRACVEVLRRFGAQVSVSGGAVSVSSGPLQAVDLDVDAIPDLAPVLALVAAAAQGRSRLFNAGRLRYKESDRLASTAALLNALGGQAHEEADALVLTGQPRLSGGLCSAAGDHRIAMTAAVAASICSGPVHIQGAQAVDKSYPGFFDDFNALGGSAALE